MKSIEVVAAVIKNDNGEFFCAKRNNYGETANKWEFPGGKIEIGETHKQALTREIKEELDTNIIVGEFITTVLHRYKTFDIIMHAYHAKIISGNLTIGEHTDSKWVNVDNLMKLDWADADIPIVKKLIMGN